MVEQDWSEEARKYRSLTEQERSEYWVQLTAAQQQALTAALNSKPSNGSETGRRGCGCNSPVTAGCAGMILGVLLTIGVEVTLLTMGVSAVNDTLQTISGTGGSGSAPAAPADIDHLSANELLSYCGTEWEQKYQRIASVCSEQRENDRINEKIYRERQAQ